MVCLVQWVSPTSSWVAHVRLPHHPLSPGPVDLHNYREAHSQSEISRAAGPHQRSRSLRAMGVSFALCAAAASAPAASAAGASASASSSTASASAAGALSSLLTSLACVVRID